MEGKIKIDGRDIRDYTIKSLRSNIGLVQQDIFLFAGTIRENIRYGRIDATDEEIEEAARKANIHDFMLDSRMVMIPRWERGPQAFGRTETAYIHCTVFLKPTHSAVG